MKIAQLMLGSSIDFENRKRAMQRRGMGEAYKKTQQYQSPKNPMLEVLENLLSGKTEKDLHAADQVKRGQGALNGASSTFSNEPQESASKNPKVQIELNKFEQTERDVITHENAHKSVGGDLVGAVSYTYTEGPDNKPYIDGGEVSISSKVGTTPEDTLEILERVKAAALAPADPSPQDLRVAASANAQIQQTRAEISGERYEESTLLDEEPFTNESLTVEIPERFLNDFEKRDALQPTVFGRDLESLMKERAFQKASMKYSSHIAMVQNGYRSFTEPTFSRTA